MTTGSLIFKMWNIQDIFQASKRTFTIILSCLTVPLKNVHFNCDMFCRETDFQSAVSLFSGRSNNEIVLCIFHTDKFEGFFMFWNL